VLSLSLIFATPPARAEDAPPVDAAHGLDFARKTVESLTKALGPDHAKVAAAERVRAALASELGVGAEVVDAAEDALRITRLGKPVAADLAADENTLGEGLVRIGRYSEAERHLTAASALLEREPRSVLQATVWSNLGDLALEVGYAQGAKRWLERAQSALSSQGGDSRRELVTVLLRLGEVARRSSAIGDALRFDGQALSMAIEAYGPDDEEVGRAQAALGSAILDEGRALDAEPIIRRSIDVLTARLGPDHVDLARPRTLLAECLLLEDKAADSAGELSRAFRIELRRLDALLTRSRPQDLRHFLETTNETTWVATSLALRPGAPAEVVRDALGMILTRKSLDMDMERFEARAARAATGNDARDVLARLTTVRADLAKALLQGAPSSVELRNLERTDGRLELSLSRLTLAASDSPAKVRVIDAATVAKALPPASALVEIVLFKVYGTQGMGGSYRVAAYVARPQGDVQIRDLGSVEALGLRVGALRTAVQTAQPSADLLRDAYSAFVLPWADAVDKAEALFIAPDGPLTLVPFEILSRPDGKSLLDTAAITYLSSGRDLVDLATPHPLRRELGSALLVGDPDYDGAPSLPQTPVSPQALFAGVRWPRLPGTADEIRTLVSLLPGATVRLGGDASASAISGAATAHVVHIATHGFFLDTAGALAEKSRGLVLDVARPSSEPSPTRTGVLESLSDHPEIRSGLVFAGVNAGGGYLTASEVGGIDLSSTDLVVLSACETGVGETTAGMGVSGLRRSLAVAGARSEIISLWKVDDAATAELMKQFYGNVSRGMGRSAALQAAKVAVRTHSEWSLPYYWGAFQLFGDWRPILESASVTPVATLPPRAGCGACTAGAGADTGGPLGLTAAALLVLGAALRRRRLRRGVRGSISSVAFSAAILAGSSMAYADPPGTMAEALELNQRYLQKGMQGDYTHVLPMAERALRIEPDNDIFLASAATLSGALKEFKKARGYYVHAIEAALAVGARFRAQSYALAMDRLAQSENVAVADAFKTVVASVGTTQVTRGTEDADAQIAAGRSAIEQGNLPAALDAATKAEAICRQQLPGDAVRLARARSLEGLAMAGAGSADGVKRLEDGILELTNAVGKDNPEVLIDRATLANALRALGRAAEAATVLEGVVADGSRRFGKDSAFVVMARTNLLETYSSGGKPQLAIAMGQQTLEPCRRQLGIHSMFCLQIIRSIAKAEYVAGNMTAAHDAATRALGEELTMKGIGGSSELSPQHYTPPPERPEIVEMLNLLVAGDLGPGKHDPARELQVHLFERQRALGRDAVAAMHVELTLALFELQSGKIDVAMKQLLDMHRRADAAYGAYAPFALQVSMAASTALASAGRFKEIEALVVETSKRVRDALGVTNEIAIGARFNEGYVKAHLARPDGVAIMREAAAQAATTMGTSNPLAVGMQAQVDAMSKK
jgi:CHAT domain-containing protein/tetratricopeptide (TPR) repeat protein